MRCRAMLFHRSVIVTEANTSATSQLLGAHGRYVNEEKSAFNGRRLDGNDRRGLFACLWGGNIDGLVHTEARLAHDVGRVLLLRPAGSKEQDPAYGLSEFNYAATSTLIVRGLASSRYGSFTVSTPFL